jgi:hypothetical protein
MLPIVFVAYRYSLKIIITDGKNSHAIKPNFERRTVFADTANPFPLWLSLERNPVFQSECIECTNDEVWGQTNETCETVRKIGVFAGQISKLVQRGRGSDCAVIHN